MSILFLFQVSNSDSLVPVLLELNGLRTLDISEERENHPFEVFGPTRSKANDLLKATDALPDLIHLDISGKDEVDATELHNFIK